MCVYSGISHCYYYENQINHDKGFIAVFRLSTDWVSTSYGCQFSFRSAKSIPRVRFDRSVARQPLSFLTQPEAGLYVWVLPSTLGYSLQ